MMKIKFLIIIDIFIQINPTFNDNSKCQISNYCGSESYGCSVYGNCNYRIFDYYKINGTAEDKLPHCECFQDYSSYDIEVLKSDSKVLCCYKKKGMLTAFFLELFIGFGAGHFYLGNYIFACVKLGIQLFLYFTVGCVLYFACTREHSFESISNDINNNENINKNIMNENKIIEKKNENNEMIDENENNDINNYNNEYHENKNNDSKNQSFELEENRENEIMFRNFISCPKSMFVIKFSIIFFFLFHIVDICLISFGVFKDGNGEELYMWI